MTALQIQIYNVYCMMVLKRFVGLDLLWFFYSNAVHKFPVYMTIMYSAIVYQKKLERELDDWN